MNTSLFIFIVFSTLSLSSAQSPTAIRDTDGYLLRSGVSYYILPVIRGRGGGITLAPAATNETCPMDVVQENNEVRNGLPLTFVAATTNKDGIIFTSTDLNIMFSSATMCIQSPVWRVEFRDGERVVSSHGILGSPGRGTSRNWFKIEKYGSDYKLVFCPGVCNTCRPDCADIGSTIAKNGRRTLVLNNNPLMVMFKRADY